MELVSASTVTADAPEVLWVDFFNTVRFFLFNRKSARGWYFRMIAPDAQEPLCTAHFTEKESGFFVSAVRGTYGGVEMQTPNAPLLEKFIGDIENFLKKEGAERMQITLAPLIYHPERSALVTSALGKRGWTVASQEIDHFLHVDSTPLMEKMERNNVKRVRKCEREKCSFEALTNPVEYPQIFEIIKSNRERKGYPVTITLEHLLASKKAFPENWLFFGVRKEEALIAVSICIRINPTTLYVLYWADIAEAHTLSPVAFLASRLYTFCQDAGITLLDIGVSSENGVPNIGLTTFKKGLGCEETLKLSFVKTLVRHAACPP